MNKTMSHSSTASISNENFLTLCSNGDVAKVKVALINGADANSKDAWDETALMRASEEGHAEIIRILLDCGANISAIDKNGRTALAWAKEKKQTEVIRLLKSRGAH